MSVVHDILAQLRSHLDGLPGTDCRPEFGNLVFYVGGTKFAALTDRVVLMHLPSADLIATLKKGFARPFVSAGALGRHGLIEIGLTAAPVDTLQSLLTTSHQAARHSHRRQRTRQPSRARRRGPGVTK